MAYINGFITYSAEIATFMAIKGVIYEIKTIDVCGVS